VRPAAPRVTPRAADAADDPAADDVRVDRLVVYPLPLENPADVTTFLERHADLPR
jgi:hypothetical protein